MSSTFFRCQKHIVPCQHIRGYPRSLAKKQEDILHLEVKQYAPRSNPEPQVGDVTIIGAHSNAFPKELYEPLWDDLLQHANKTGAFRIRSIWFADVASQGASGILNEDKVGNDRKHSKASLMIWQRHTNESLRSLMV